MPSTLEKQPCLPTLNKVIEEILAGIRLALSWYLISSSIIITQLVKCELKNIQIICGLTFYPNLVFSNRVAMNRVLLQCRKVLDDIYILHLLRNWQANVFQFNCLHKGIFDLLKDGLR